MAWWSYDTVRRHAPRLAFLRDSASGMRKRRAVEPVLLIVAGLVFLVLVGYGVWLLQLERGARALARGDVERATELYASAEGPFHSILARLFPDQYGRVLFPKINVLYNRGKIS